MVEPSIQASIIESQAIINSQTIESIFTDFGANHSPCGSWHTGQNVYSFSAREPKVPILNNKHGFRNWHLLLCNNSQLSMLKYNKIVLGLCFKLHSGLRSCSWVRYLPYRYFVISIISFSYFMVINAI